jgi:hypothetical protein
MGPLPDALLQLLTAIVDNQTWIEPQQRLSLEEVSATLKAVLEKLD